MTQEAMMTELLALREQAEQTAQNINQISQKLYDEKQLLRKVVDEYGAKRVEFFKQEFMARGMTWCTYCSKAIPEGEAEFLLIEGRETYSCGYENSCYGFRSFSKLHRACPVCRERALDEHGTRGIYDTSAKDQTSFYAFRVEKREDGYYARRFGNWVKLEDGKYKLSEPSSQLVEKLAEEWNFPPRIEIESKWPSLEDKLVIHERTAVSKAS